MQCNLVPMSISVQEVHNPTQTQYPSPHNIPRATQFLQNNVKYSQNVENMFPLPPTCGVSILSAGNSSISIEYDEDVEGFGVCARRSSNGTFEGFGGFGSSAMDGLSKYGNSSSGIILVGGVDARPLIRKGRFTCALGSHSSSSLLQTYLRKLG